MEEQKINESPELKNKTNDSLNNPVTEAMASSNSDIEKNKPMAIIGYIIPILFFIPLVTDAKESAFAKFHANQQLILLIIAIGVNIVGAVIPIIGWFIIWPLGWVAVVVLAIMGVLNAVKGEVKKLPIVGEFQIIN